MQYDFKRELSEEERAAELVHFWLGDPHTPIPGTQIEHLTYFGWVWELHDAVNMTEAKRADGLAVDLSLWAIGGNGPGIVKYYPRTREYDCQKAVGCTRRMRTIKHNGWPDAATISIKNYKLLQTAIK